MRISIGPVRADINAEARLEHGAPMRLRSDEPRLLAHRKIRQSPFAGGGESEAAEELVEFVGGVEVGFEFAGGAAFAQVVEAAREKIKSGGEDFLISENDVAPGGIGASGEAKRIAEARTREGDGEAVFVQAIVQERGERDGGELRKMRGQADGVVVLRGAEPERARADFFENFHEGGDAGVLLSKRGTDERVGVAAEEISVGVRDAGEFPAGHGVTAQEAGPVFARKKRSGGLGDADLGAAGVGDERVRRRIAGDFLKMIKGRGDGKPDVNQIGALQSGREAVRKGFVEGAASLRFTNDIGAVPARDVYLCGVFAKSEGERAADEAGAEDGDAGDEMGGHGWGEVES